MKKLGRKRVSRYPLAYRTQILNRILKEDLGVRQAAREYGVASITIYRWLNQMEEEEHKKPTEAFSEDEDLASRVKCLEEALRLEQLRSAAYREMIQQAEAYFNISIEKKSGSKPSQQ
ncbi:MAG: transposase [Bacteroidota bacterium]